MKDLLIRRLPHGQMYEIVYEKGGTVPQILKGKFNKIKYAEKAIEAYKIEQAKPKREYRKSKVREDGKNSTKSRSK